MKRVKPIRGRCVESLQSISTENIQQRATRLKSEDDESSEDDQAKPSDSDSHSSKTTSTVRISCRVIM